GGNGILVLSNDANLYGGETAIQGGTLRVQGGNAIGDRSNVTLANQAGVIFDLNNTTEAVGSLGGAGTTGGTVAIGAGTLTINEFSASTYSGQITGSGTIIKNGTSDLTLNGVATTFSGAIIVNQNQFFISGSGISNMNNVASIVLNSGSLIIDNNGATTAAERVNNAATISLMNTGGINGLYTRTDQAGTRTENLGAVTLVMGANTLSASTATSGATAEQILASLTRSGNSTALIRGTNLGTSGATRHGEVVVTGALSLVGGGGVAGTKTISILPWAIGEASVDTSVAATMVGNSFVTHVAGTGFRALTDAEFETSYANLSGAPTSNFSIAADASGLATATANALRLNTFSGAVTMAGAGGGSNQLTITSGAILHTAGSSTNGATLSGYDGILTGSNEYVISVTSSNATPANAVFTIDSALTSGTAALTKSGAGTLVLTSTASTFNGPVTINQGVLQASSLSHLGTGSLIVLSGGTSGVQSTASFRFGAAFDLSLRTVQFGQTGNPSLKTGGGILDTNGFNVTLANPIGNGGNGGLTKVGNGILTLNAAVNYTGDTTITAGTLAYGANDVLPTSGTLIMANATLDMGANSGTVGALGLTGNGTIAGAGNFTLAGDMVNFGGNRTLSITNSGNTIFGGGSIFLSESVTARTLTMDVAAGSTATVNSAISDGAGAPGTFAKTGLGTLVVGDANTFIGTFAVNGGLVNAVLNTPTKSSLGGILSLGGGTLRLTKTDGSTTALTYNSSTLVVNTSSTVAFGSNTGTIVFNTGAFTRSGNNQSTVTFDLTNVGSSTINVGSTVFGGWATVKTGSGTFFAGKDGSNNLVAATTVVKTDVSTWLLADNVTDDAPVTPGYTGTFTLGAGVNSIRFNTAAASTVTIAPSETLNVASGGILATSVAANATITGGYLTSVGGANDLVINTEAGGQLTIASAIRAVSLSNAATINTRVTKVGDGTLVLSGNNNF
ncbi:MAG: autotransporter-associated beta strand repeat-containing protein, partial [bacterium]